MTTETRRADLTARPFRRPFAEAIHRVLRRPRRQPAPEIDVEQVVASPTLEERAAALNAELYADVNAIPPAELERLVARLEEFGKARNYPDPYLKAWLLHAERLYLTFAKVRALLPFLPGSHAEPIGLECGHASVFTDVLLEDVPGVRWRAHVGDLRSPWEVDEGSVDLIVCTEVLEHLSDPAVGLQSEFWSTGLKSALKEVRRALKPGGVFLATTPNVASMLHFRLLAEGASPWFCAPHVREYTIFQMVLELEEAGLQMIEARSVHCMTSPDRYDYSRHFRALLELGGFTEYRGDDLFLCARRPD